MQDPPEHPYPRQPGAAKAGGFFIVAGLVVGVILGIVYRQPSIGMIGGFTAGAVAAIVLWLFDRRKD
jgi:hypothetical protein